MVTGGIEPYIIRVLYVCVYKELTKDEENFVIYTWVELVLIPEKLKLVLKLKVSRHPESPLAPGVLLTGQLSGGVSK